MNYRFFASTLSDCGEGESGDVIMKRRDFMTLVGGSLAWPFGALAQGPDTPVIGFLNSASRPPFAALVAAFHKGLSEQRYWDGRNVKVEESWANGDESRLTPLVRDLVQRKVNLIAATGGIRSAQAAREATSDIPVLFISGVNPVELGLVSSFNHPGHNLTGVNLDTTHLISKRLEMLHEFVPADTKVAVLASPGRFSPEAEAKFYNEKRMVVIKVNPDGALEDAFKAAVEQGARSLLVAADPFYFNRRDRIAALAAQYKIPALYPGREYAAAGGLLSYGPNISDAYRQIGVYAGRILNGARPDELPVVSPQKWELVINRKAAKALPLAIPPWLFTRADETIE
jgi:putative tryptophan/tyrosine transport system substrate-binding protein